MPSRDCFAATDNRAFLSAAGLLIPEHQDAPMQVGFSASPRGTGTTSATGHWERMARYFFDFRSDGKLSSDEEGSELPDVGVAHEQAVGALADGLRDIVMEGAKDQRFTIEVRDDLGAVLEVSAVLESRFLRKQ